MSIIFSCCDWTDVAQAECEISALHYAPKDTRFISVSVLPFSSLNCAFHVRLLAETQSSDAVIIASADPRAPGIPREPIVVHFDQPNIYLICPNIGITTLMLERYTPSKVIKLNFNRWKTSVFNGRDIYAPTAGRIVSGASLEELGDQFPLTSLHNLDVEYGTVLHIDNYGNIKLYAYDDLTKANYVEANGRQLSIVSNFILMSGDLAEKGELVATNGSSFGLIEIQAKAERQGAIGAAEILGVRIGDLIDLTIH